MSKANYTVRCCPAYQQWMAELGALVGRNNSDLIDHGLRLVAREARFRPPPMRATRSGRRIGTPMRGGPVAGYSGETIPQQQRLEFVDNKPE
jgi:hypothetical protein